jgi:hypothetical protein
MRYHKLFEICGFRQRSGLVGFVEFHAIARVIKGVKTSLGRKGLKEELPFMAF